MKKFKTSEDLDQVYIQVPLNMARTILTMCHEVYTKAQDAIERAKIGGVLIGERQAAAINQYIQTQEHVSLLVEDALSDNVSIEDQQDIKAYEASRTTALKEELVQSITKHMESSCSNPDCEACTKLRKVVDEYRPSSKTKQEFDLTDLPDGTTLVPGSDEEN